MLPWMSMLFILSHLSSARRRMSQVMLFLTVCSRVSKAEPFPQTGTCLFTRLQSIGAGLERLDQLETLILCEIGNHAFFDGNNLVVALPKTALPDRSEVGLQDPSILRMRVTHDESCTFQVRQDEIHRLRSDKAPSCQPIA